MPESTPKLHCLGGSAPPRELSADLAALLVIPAEARDPLWDILGPSLADPVPPGLEAQVDTFCEAFGVKSADLARAVRACRFLLRAAASRDLARADFASDLAALGAASAAVGAILLPRYDLAKARVRRELFDRSVTDHGKLVDRISFRVDTTVASSHADRLGARIVTLTLGYRERDRHDEITLQLPPEAVEELLRICQKVMP